MKAKQRDKLIVTFGIVVTMVVVVILCMRPCWANREFANENDQKQKQKHRKNLQFQINRNQSESKRQFETLGGQVGVNQEQIGTNKILAESNSGQFETIRGSIGANTGRIRALEQMLQKDEKTGSDIPRMY